MANEMVDHLLSEIGELAPRIEARAAEIEAAGRYPADLVEELRALGVFRMFVPGSHGGLDIDLVSSLRIFEEPSPTAAESSRLAGSPVIVVVGA